MQWEYTQMRPRSLKADAYFNFGPRWSLMNVLIKILTVAFRKINTGLLVVQNSVECKTKASKGHRF
jgi:hypothetical protein